MRKLVYHCFTSKINHKPAIFHKSPMEAKRLLPWGFFLFSCLDGSISCICILSEPIYIFISLSVLFPCSSSAVCLILPFHSLTMQLHTFLLYFFYVSPSSVSIPANFISPLLVIPMDKHRPLFPAPMHHCFLIDEFPAYNSDKDDCYPFFFSFHSPV